MSNSSNDEQLSKTTPNSSVNSSTKRWKIVSIGKSGVGKSALTYRFINYSIPNNHDPTIEDKFKSTTIVDDVQYDVEVVDTSGNERYTNLMDSWINLGEGFWLVFAINDEDSFKALSSKRDLILKLKETNAFPIILVGNKQDLDEERKISYSEAKSLANRWNVEYIETSAATDFNCKEVFEKISLKIVKRRRENIKKDNNCTIF